MKEQIKGLNKAVKQFEDEKTEAVSRIILIGIRDSIRQLIIDTNEEKVEYIG